MPEITSLSYDLEAAFLEPGPDFIGEVSHNLRLSLSDNVTPTTELEAALLTLGDAVFGVVVGKFESGRVGPAVSATESDVDAI